MYQSSFIVLSFLVMIILAIYQSMTQQYLLKTTITTDIRMINLLDTNAIDKTIIGYLGSSKSGPETQKDNINSTDLYLHQQNHSRVEQITTNSILQSTDANAKEVDAYFNKSLDNILRTENKSKSEMERTGVSLNETTHDTNKLRKVFRTNVSSSNYGNKLTSKEDIFARRNLSKLENEKKHEMLSSDDPGNKTRKVVVKSDLRQRYYVSKTRNVNSKKQRKSDCQKFIYENINNVFNDAVFEKLKRKCSAQRRYTNDRLDKLFLKELNEIIECPATEVKYSTKKLPLVALASYPGSGNTWTRVLIESLTGIHTGSLYRDPLSNFPGSKMCPTNSGVFIVKTHSASDLVKRNNCQPSKFSKAIFILRNPYDAIIAEFNRRNGGKVGFASKSDFHSSRWRNFLSISNRWKKTALYWMATYRKPLHVISYENLQTNTILEMYKVMKFLNRGVTLKMLYCLVNKPKDEYYRGAKPDWMEKSKLFGERAINQINRDIIFVSKRIFQKSFRSTLQSYLLRST